MPYTYFPIENIDFKSIYFQIRRFTSGVAVAAPSTSPRGKNCLKNVSYTYFPIENHVFFLFDLLPNKRFTSEVAAAPHHLPPPPRPASPRLLPLSACLCRCRTRRNCRHRLRQRSPPSTPSCRPTRRRPPIWPRRGARRIYNFMVAF